MTICASVIASLSFCTIYSLFYLYPYPKRVLFHSFIVYLSTLVNSSYSSTQTHLKHLNWQSHFENVLVCVVIHVSERGAGYWKLNNSYLQRKDYVDKMNKEIDTVLKLCEQKNAIESWETLKTRIKKATVQYSQNTISENQVVISNLLEKLNDYQSDLPLSKEDMENMENTQKDLDDKMLEKAKGMLFRSKVRWYELGEKSTKYFFSLEKARYNTKTCYKLIDEQEGEIIDNNRILQKQQEFYQDLYSRDDEVVFNLTNKYNIYVPEDIKQIQEQQITQLEVEQAIKSMKNNKTPGQDGISVDFYKVFWTKISKIFMQLIEQVFSDGILHQSARKGILNLIPKAEKDTRYIKNLRPITLLNTDYKIIEKTIANKMSPALEKIINKDQRGFMKDRRISVNIRKLLDLITYTEIEDLEAVILSMDFVKCFDRCSFSILFGSLDFFRFGSIVKQWTQILYNKFTVCIQNNGHFSKEIPIKKGVHQGGCCSSVYFLVIAEILAICLRDNEDIQGINIQNIKNLLNQFADDMDISTLCQEKSLKSIFRELNKFYYQSGFKVSYEKTTIYRIGSLRYSNAQM